MKMRRFVLIHGMSCHLDKCFGEKVKARLKARGYEIVEPFFPLGKDISLDGWNEVIDKVVQNVDEDTCFLCHSLGCLYVIKYLFRKHANCNAVIVVAGGILNRPIEEFAFLSDFMPTEEELEHFKTHTQKVYDITSNNDHIFTQEELDLYVTKTNAQKIFIPNCGHFGRSSGVKDIPQIETILDKI